MYVFIVNSNNGLVIIFYLLTKHIYYVSIKFGNICCTSEWFNYTVVQFYRDGWQNKDLSVHIVGKEIVSLLISCHVSGIYKYVYMHHS